jgi:hypothetical protein
VQEAVRRRLLRVFAPRGLLPGDDARGLLPARIYEVFPLVCPHCGGAMRIIAYRNRPDGAALSATNVPDLDVRHADTDRL